MSDTYQNRVIETSSNTPTNTGTVTINLSGTSPTMTFIGSGTSAGRLFDDVYASADTIPSVHIYQTNSPSLWCVANITFTAGTPDTLTFVAANVHDGSAGAGALVTFTGTVTCVVEADALRTQIGYLASRGHIEGGVPAYSSTTAITVSACDAAINGKRLATTGTTTLTSGSTMKDLANSTVTIGATKAYWVFAYDNAGTLEFRVEEIDGTGDGAALVWDSALDYWKAASTGAASRRIGKFWTNASSQIINFDWTTKGRHRTMLSVQGPTLLNQGTATTFTSVTMTPFVSADDEVMWLAISARRSSGQGAGHPQPLVTFDGGTSNSINLKCYVGAEVTTISFGNQKLPNSGTLHYMNNGGGSDTSISVNGVEMYI